ncbi:hypothetical protein SISNIDRAFT_502237 [Sistotremastrum niveocremeum HHB9708]|uniref:Uncharacterized protein n=1 Tax=Sistotremastrum niveocremeum HHB9708 TaxID=1314777 RepID=A0A164W8W2_9AGAM|nr:hypothetical protein SISNIDRAFT_502237 [Sistotremastrum niveocremeum HHB9708]
MTFDSSFDPTCLKPCNILYIEDLEELEATTGYIDSEPIAHCLILPPYQRPTSEPSRITILIRTKNLPIPSMSSRAEMVNVLRGLGVDIPADTKMSETRLSEKLDKALDCTQLASQRLPSLSLSPQSLPSWDGKNVGEDFTPDNATENNVIMGLLQSPEEMEPVGNDDFMDLRVVLLSLSYQYDTGRIATVIQNKQGTSAMCIKIVKVLKLNDKTPVIVILYDHARESFPSFFSHSSQAL